MYNEAWARDVLANYRKLCTRAQQMDGVIEQVLDRTYHWKCPPNVQTLILIDSIRRKGPAKLWTLYKRLNKRMPLDTELLDLVCRAIIKARLRDYLDDAKQNYLTFV